MTLTEARSVHEDAEVSRLQNTIVAVRCNGQGEEADIAEAFDELERARRALHVAAAVTQHFAVPEFR